MNTFSLKGKTAIVTGASSGIGRSIALKFAEKGANVHILDIDFEASKKVQNLINKETEQCSIHQCNVANHNEVRRVIQSIYGQAKIDILVNNAGIGFVGNLEQTNEHDLDRLYSVNIKGVYNCLFALVPHFKENGQGVILNLASIAASVGIPDRFAYSMTKAAVLNMTYTVAMDYIKYGIRCNSISPARVHTPLVDEYIHKNYPGREEEMFEKLSSVQPLGRMGTPEEIANLALFLCSDEASFITGTDYPIDGGFLKLMP